MYAQKCIESPITLYDSLIKMKQKEIKNKKNDNRRNCQSTQERHEAIDNPGLLVPFSYKLEMLYKNHSLFLKGKNREHKGLRKTCDYFCSLPHYLTVQKTCSPNSPDSQSPGTWFRDPGPPNPPLNTDAFLCPALPPPFWSLHITFLCVCVAKFFSFLTQTPFLFFFSL